MRAYGCALGPRLCWCARMADSLPCTARASRDVNRPSTVADRCRTPPRSACESTTALPAGRVSLGSLSHVVLLACLPRCASVRNSANALAAASGRRRRSSSGTTPAATAASLLSSKKTSQTVHQQQPFHLRHPSSSMATSFTLTSRPNDAGSSSCCTR